MTVTMFLCTTKMDPLANVLGKDLAQFIYRFVHQALMAELHREYFGRLKEILQSGAIVVASFLGCRVLFNYRHPQFLWYQSRIWNGKKHCQGEKLPANYWDQKDPPL